MALKLGVYSDIHSKEGVYLLETAFSGASVCPVQHHIS